MSVILSTKIGCCKKEFFVDNNGDLNINHWECQYIDGKYEDDGYEDDDLMFHYLNLENVVFPPVKRLIFTNSSIDRFTNTTVFQEGMTHLIMEEVYFQDCDNPISDSKLPNSLTHFRYSNKMSRSEPWRLGYFDTTFNLPPNLIEYNMNSAYNLASLENNKVPNGLKRMCLRYNIVDLENNLPDSLEFLDLRDSGYSYDAEKLSIVFPDKLEIILMNGMYLHGIKKMIFPRSLKLLDLTDIEYFDDWKTVWVSPSTQILGDDVFIKDLRERSKMYEKQAVKTIEQYVQKYGYNGGFLTKAHAPPLGRLYLKNVEKFDQIMENYVLA